MITNTNIQTEHARKLEAIAGGEFSVGVSETNTDLPNDAVVIDIENETLDIKNAPFHISEQVAEIMQSMEATVHEKRITLSQSIEPGIILHTDVDMVAQVFTILYDNAIKYTEENGHIEVSLTQSNRLVTCTVKNSGKGFTPQDLPKIIDRFYRVDPSRTGETGGYGLDCQELYEYSRHLPVLTLG